MFLEINGKPSISLELGQLYMIGKRINGIKSANFIHLKDEDYLDQRHCIIETSPNNEAFVFDLCSAKGTLLNSEPLNGLKKACLKNGDILKLGQNEIKYIHDRLEVSHDSSGFLEVNKNSSGIFTSSPNCTAQHPNHTKQISNNFLVPSVPRKRSITPNKSLNVSKIESISNKIQNNSTDSLNNRRSDSFTIPETQYCKPLNSSDASNISVAESLHDADKIKFNFGNLDSLDDDDELWIPETQEIVSLSQKSRLTTGVGNEDIKTGVLEEEFSGLKESSAESSQFRICTQDYNEGFGEEAEDGLTSQIIPIIKHQPVRIDNITKSSNDSSTNQENMSAKTDHEATVLRDCPTPDIFDFKAIEAIQEKCQDNVNKKSTEKLTNLLDEDEEDLLPTQVLFPSVAEKKSDIEKPCLEKENEEILTLSDKENKRPVDSEFKTDLAATQLFEAKSRSSNSGCNSSDTNTNPSYFSALNTDEADDLLTQAILMPSYHHSSTSSAANKSKFLGVKDMPKSPVTTPNRTETTSLKKTVAETIFKKPNKEFSSLKKTSSTTSETDLDLLMCTPQLIKDNIFVETSSDLEKNVLAIKYGNLIGNDTDDEEEDEDDLVKLINVPKNALDFDKLLPHLNKRPRIDKKNEEQSSAKEAQKIYKFNVLFGKERDEKQSKASTAKPSTLSRDKGKVERRGRSKVKSDRSRSRDKVKEIVKKDKAASVRKEKPEIKESDNKTRVKRSKEKKQAKSLPNQENSNVEERNTERVRKRRVSEKTNVPISQEYSKDKSQEIITTMSLIYDEPPSTSKDVLRKSSKTTRSKADNLDNVATEKIKRVTRSRSSSQQTEFQDNDATKSSVNKNIPNQTKNKVIAKTLVERKRKADTSPVAVPTKVERKKSLQSDDASKSSSTAINISTTMVDQELFKNLLQNSKGLWKIAKNPSDSHVLVMDKPFRTFKFLLAMARGIPIVTSHYLKKINDTQSKNMVRTSDYLFADVLFEKKYEFSLIKSLQAAKNRKIFTGYEFLMTSHIVPNPEEIKAIVEASGGYVHNKTPPKPKENQKLYLVTTNEDRREWHKYRRLNKNIVFVSTEAIMSAVMQQNCEKIKNYIFA